MTTIRIGGVQLDGDLPPAKVATGAGYIEVPCVFRRNGLVVLRYQETGRYNVTHEFSGMSINGSEHNSGHGSLAICLMLLTLTVDWTQSASDVHHAVAADAYASEVMAMLGSGRIRVVDMTGPKARA